jgi:N-acetyl-gamma-glutamyl-phosphate reductase
LKVGIIGATGYGGIELYRILSNHPNVTRCNLYTSSDEGKPYVSVYPHLHDLCSDQLHPLEPERVKEENEVIFLATPSGVSANLTPKLIDDRVKIIDLSGDLRLKEAGQYEKWYKKTPAAENVLNDAVYGLSEINRSKIKDAQIIANPGCYPTATLLGLAPIVQNQLVKPKTIIVDAKSGVSGAGRKPSIGTSFVELQDNLKIYKVHEHQHIPEIEQQLHEWDKEVQEITFSTHLIPMTRGIMATIYVELLEDWENKRLLDLYKQFYKDKPFVRVRDEGVFPSTKDVYGSNYCDIGLKLDPRTNRLTIVSVIDNLMKGAAGQAVQNFNIMFGIEETTALRFIPVYP